MSLQTALTYGGEMGDDYRALNYPTAAPNIN